MTDRELLELAAKAAAVPHGADRLDFGLSLTLPSGRHEHLPQWNPLTDDGDALRLAVKLRLDIETHALENGDFRRVTITWNRGDWYDGIEQDSEFGTLLDDASMTRRAIVRAAARIGKAMK